MLEPQLEANAKTITRKNSLAGFITCPDLIALKIHTLHSRIASKHSLSDGNTCTVQHNHTADLNIEQNDAKAITLILGTSGEGWAKKREKRKISWNCSQ